MPSRSGGDLFVRSFGALIGAAGGHWRADPNTQKRIELNLDLIGCYDEQLSKVEWHIKKHASAVDYHSLMLLRLVSGIGRILSLVIGYEIHTIERFPTV